MSDRDELERRAAEGDASALFDLGTMAEEIGDYEAARSWWGQLAERGESRAMEAIALLDSLTDDLRRLVETMIDQAELAVGRGVEDEESIIDWVLACTEDEDAEIDDGLRANLARAVVGRVIVDQLKLQASWPKKTDCDKLDAAFAQLNRKGVLSLTGDVCCSSCAHSELSADVLGNAKARGYAFYSAQDISRVVPDSRSGIFIGYGLPNGDPEATAEVGREVVSALSHQELDATWDGDPSEKIWLALTWQRRWKRGKKRQPVDPRAAKIIDDAIKRPPRAIAAGGSSRRSSAACEDDAEARETVNAVEAELAKGNTLAAACIAVARSRGIRPLAVLVRYEKAAHGFATGAPPRPPQVRADDKKVTRSLAGKTFVLTGKLDSMSRAEAAEAIRARGGRVLDSLSGNTDYLIVGTKPGTKQDRARALRIKVLGESAFLRLLQE
jgi:hypothetical protein